MGKRGRLILPLFRDVKVVDDRCLDGTGSRSKDLLDSFSSLQFFGAIGELVQLVLVRLQFSSQLIDITTHRLVLRLLHFYLHSTHTLHALH